MKMTSFYDLHTMSRKINLPPKKTAKKKWKADDELLKIGASYAVRIHHLSIIPV